ncbi:MAG: hypothetical protein AB7S90_09275 [Marinobacterium sp.]|jgi:hypothetical protein
MEAVIIASIGRSMKYLLTALLIFSSPLCVAENEIAYLKGLDTKASKYRMMAIECVTDMKLTKRKAREINSCNSFFKFVQEDYPSLKSDLELAELEAKDQGSSEGLQSENLRERLVFIMSVRSHMNIAGTASKAIGE